MPHGLFRHLRGRIPLIGQQTRPRRSGRPSGFWKASLRASRIGSSKTYFKCLCRAWTAAGWASGLPERVCRSVAGRGSPRRGRKRTHRQNQQRMRPRRRVDGPRATPWTARAAARLILRGSGLNRGTTARGSPGTSGAMAAPIHQSPRSPAGSRPPRRPRSAPRCRWTRPTTTATRRTRTASGRGAAAGAGCRRTPGWRRCGARRAPPGRRWTP
mmetsp:Transcript_4286/g.9502  ORF Transcript_4286/g.9502 Transcript_4286/m.9502 type:complete len:214 (+) Transcript_4286:661-1302(+)